MEPNATGAAPSAARFPAAVVAATAAYLLFATTTGFFWIDSWHDEQRAAQLVLLIVVALAACLLWETRCKARIGPVVVVTLALGAASAILSGHAPDALAEVALAVLLCLLAATAGQFSTTSGSAAVRAISRAALFIAAAHVAGAFTRYAAALQVEQSLGTEIWLLGFSNPRVASSFYALLIPFTALETLADIERDRRLRGIAWIALVALWTTAAGLEARALWLSYGLAASVLLALAWAPSTRRLVHTLTVTAAIGVAIHFLLPLPAASPGAALNASRDLTSLSSRDILWRLALDATLQHPLFGVGPGQFARIESFAGAHPHNWMLQLSSEWGTPALVAVLVGLFALFRRFRASSSEPSPEGALRGATALAVLVGLASALVDGTLVMPSTQIAFSLAFGLFVGTLPRPGARIGATWSPSSVGFRWAAALIIAAAAVWLGAYGVSSYGRQEAERKAFENRFPGKWLVPRFWESGLMLVR